MDRETAYVLFDTLIEEISHQLEQAKQTPKALDQLGSTFAQYTVDSGDLAALRFVRSQLTIYAESELERRRLSERHTRLEGNYNQLMAGTDHAQQTHEESRREAVLREYNYQILAISNDRLEGGDARGEDGVIAALRRLIQGFNWEYDA